MEDRTKSDPLPSPESSEVSEGWTGTRPIPKRPRPDKPSGSPLDLSDLEKQVNAGWDEPES